MPILNPFRIAAAAGVALVASAPGGSLAQQNTGRLCGPLIQEELLQLEEFELEVELARAEFAARVRIFEMIDQLWEKRVIERMVYLESRYNRDSTRLEFEAADLVAARQKALIERFRMACGMEESPAIPGVGPDRAAARAYLDAQCDSLAKRVEAAKTDLVFDRQFLDNMRELRKENVATATEVILSERDVEMDEIRIADATRRLQTCRRDFGAEQAQDPE